MIINKDKTWQTNSEKPNEDWTGQALFVVDDNSEVANKIIALYPNFDFVLDGGVLIDVVATDKPIDDYIKAKLAEISKACEEIIYSGITINDKKYSLTLTDQKNLEALCYQLDQGAEAVPYHANGELCRFYSASEMLGIKTLAQGYVVYHTTYCNHLNAWIKRCATVEELEAIIYGVELPTDLKANFDGIMEALG